MFQVLYARAAYAVVKLRKRDKRICCGGIRTCEKQVIMRCGQDIITIDIAADLHRERCVYLLLLFY